MDAATEQYILLLLSDGNLPTGAFVASSGLESYAKHGFLSAPAPAPAPAENVADFVRYSLESYASSALPFVADAHRAVSADAPGLDRRLAQLDALYDATTLNHVARRASRAQGAALLALFAKGFARPTWLAPAAAPPAAPLVARLRLDARHGRAPGHLPVCWGVVTAALGLSAERSQHLHLFLHARGLLSAAVRMNVLGPYAAQQLLLHVVRPLVDAETARCRSLQTGMPRAPDADADADAVPAVDGPASTWPLGEILAARHDLQHSRIFNS